MDRQTMSSGDRASDVELEQWLSQVFPVVARALKLPRPMEKAARRAPKTVLVGTALRWVEMLRVGKPDEIRLIARNTPDAAAKLSTPEGQQAIRKWEASYRVVPVLRVLERAAATMLAFWRVGGYPRRAVIRALAALSASQLVSDATGIREELASVIGSCQSDTIRLIEGYAATAVADEVEKIESVDKLISRSLPFGPWVRSFWICLKLRVKGIKRGPEMDPESGHPLWRLSLILREVAGIKGKES